VGIYDARSIKIECPGTLYMWLVLLKFTVIQYLSRLHTIFTGLLKDGLQLEGLLLIGSNDKLAALPVQNFLLPAIVIQHMPAPDT
jgi:hypothetical protein